MPETQAAGAPSVLLLRRYTRLYYVESRRLSAAKRRIGVLEIVDPRTNVAASVKLRLRDAVELHRALGEYISTLLREYLDTIQDTEVMKAAGEVLNLIELLDAREKRLLDAIAPSSF